MDEIRNEEQGAPVSERSLLAVLGGDLNQVAVAVVSAAGSAVGSAYAVKKVLGGGASGQGPGGRRRPGLRGALIRNAVAPRLAAA